MTNARSKQDVVLEGGPAPPGAGTRVWRGDERQDGAVGPAQGSASAPSCAVGMAAARVAETYHGTRFQLM